MYLSRQAGAVGTALDAGLEYGNPDRKAARPTSDDAAWSNPNARDAEPSGSRVVVPRIMARMSTRQHRLRIRSLLSQDANANWVFCGDSLLSMSDRARDWPSFVTHFSQFVRWQLRRFPDVVIDSTLPEDSLALLNSQLEQRVLRFEPHAVFVMCGAEEAAAGLDGLDDFEDALLSIIRALLDRGITPVVHTPPRTLDSGDALIDSLVYVEAIRSITAEQDVPLVDHWEFWEASSIEQEEIESWYEPDSSLPGRTGHEQISELMLRKLGLSTPRPSAARRERAVANGV